MKKNILISILLSTQFSHSMLIKSILDTAANLITKRHIPKRYYSFYAPECLPELLQALNNSPENKAFHTTCIYIINDDVMPKDKKLTLIENQLKRNDFIPLHRDGLNLLQDTIKNSPHNCPVLGKSFILHAAAKNNNYPLLKIALRHMNYPDIDSCCNEQKNTALYVASQGLFPTIVETLCNNATNKNSKNEEGKTPLIGAITYPHKCLSPEKITDLLATVKTLLLFSADATIQDNNKKSAHDYVKDILTNLGYYERKTIYTEHGSIMVAYEEIQELLVAARVNKE